MPLFAGFIGPSYQARSGTFDNEIARNVYMEKGGSAANAKSAWYYGTPGLKRLMTLDHTDCRGSWSQDGLTLAVVGPTLYSVDFTGPSPVATAIAGSISDDGKPVFIESNGRGGEQVAIAGGGQLQILDLLTMALSGPIALPHTNAPTWLAFIDGYFLLGEKDTIRVWFSNLENGLIWDALDFFARSNTSDNVVGGVVLRNRVWIFGSLTSEVYYDGGDTDNPFVPYPGSVMQEGVVSMWAVGVQGESVVWMSQDTEGTNHVVRATDYAPVEISDPAISFALAKAATLADVELGVYDQEGHPFAVWTCPSLGPAGQSWAWDARESTWHERSTRNVALGQDMMWKARGFCSPPGYILCGGWNSDGLFALDLDTFEDDGGMILRVRRAPFLSEENQWMFLDQFELGIQPGVGLAVGQGSDPKVALNISGDSGQTWNSAGFSGIGKMGEYETRAIWVMLGRYRADRLVVETVQTDPVRCAWGPGAWIRATPGSGML